MIETFLGLKSCIFNRAAIRRLGGLYSLRKFEEFVEY